MKEGGLSGIKNDPLLQPNYPQWAHVGSIAHFKHLDGLYYHYVGRKVNSVKNVKHNRMPQT